MDDELVAQADFFGEANFQRGRRGMNIPKIKMRQHSLVEKGGHEPAVKDPLPASVDRPGTKSGLETTVVQHQELELQTGFVLGPAAETERGISQKRGDQSDTRKMGNFGWAKRLRYGSTSNVSRRRLDDEAVLLGSPQEQAGALRRMAYRRRKRSQLRFPVSRGELCTAARPREDLQWRRETPGS